MWHVVGPILPLVTPSSGVAWVLWWCVRATTVVREAGVRICVACDGVSDEGGQDRGQYLVELSDGSIRYGVCRPCTPHTEC